MFLHTSTRNRAGFTLIELLVVIVIIGILAGLLFPTLGAVKESARKLQAKNDLTQIVTAVKSYYTEYGKYPLISNDPKPDPTFGENAPQTADLMNVLRANTQGRDNPAGENVNPRRIVFAEWPVAKDTVNPKSGIGPNGQPYDPWGKPYLVKIDGDYDNSVPNPYTKGAGFATIGTGVIVWSLGKDGKGGQGQADKNAGDAKDDVISWQ